MLNNREISEQFEVQLNTLYNWKKTKPKLYRYLKHADYHQNRNKEINILLDLYITNINHNFTVQQIIYLIECNFELVSMEDINNFPTIFIKHKYKEIPQSGDTVLTIYNNLTKLNIIEKYILYKKIYKYKEENLTDPLQVQKDFKEFIV